MLGSLRMVLLYLNSPVRDIGVTVEQTNVTLGSSYCAGIIAEKCLPPKDTLQGCLHLRIQPQTSALKRSGSTLNAFSRAAAGGKAYFCSD